MFESMSANNCLYINKKNFNVYEHGCMDNDFVVDEAYFIDKGKNLEEAIDIAQKYQMINEVEYGISFF